MALLLPFKALLLGILRLLKGTGVKELAKLSKITDRRIGEIERGGIKKATTEEVEKLLIAMECSEAEVVIVSSCLLALHDLDPEANPVEAASQERFIAAMGRRMRQGLRSPGTVEDGVYPAPYEVEPDRAEARDSWQRLSQLGTLREMALVVRVAREYQRWALVELLCDESARAAADDAGRARDLAVLAVRVARRLRVREDWRRALLAYAAAHLANALRVAGALARTDRTMAAARRLWAAGLDPDRLLDPGRLHDLEASLRRDQQRFQESLDLLEKAAVLTRRPVQVALKLSSVLTVMERHERAVEVLTEAEPWVEGHPDARLRTVHRFNLTAALSDAGRHQEAAALLPSVRRMTRGDELDRIRTKWLEGRIAAGLGQTKKALVALADARSEFARRNLYYDVALSLVETARLLLQDGEWEAVRRLTTELVPIFERQGVHDEALKALRLFDEAVARQTATAELARRLLEWLFRARHAPGLVFQP